MLTALLSIAAVPEFALFDAIVDGRRGRVERLLSRGANPEAVSSIEDGSALAVAAAHGHDEIVEVLLDAGADPNRLSGAAADTALHRAACAGERAVIQVLLDAGAMADARSAAGETPLACAGPGTRGLLERALQAAGLDPERDGDAPAVTSHGPESQPETDVQRESPRDPLPEIFAATWADDAKQIWRLTQLGETDAYAAAGHYLGGMPVVPGSTPLHVAVAWGRFNAAGLLIDAGAAVNEGDHRGRTPLHVAVWRNRHSILLGLLSAGADASIPDLQGLTPLDYAAWLGSREDVEVLLDSSEEGRASALATAAGRGNQDVVELLLTPALDGRVALERAITGDHWQIALTLVDRGDLDLDGLLALAVQSDAPGASAVLLRRGQTIPSMQTPQDPVMRAAFAGFLSESIWMADEGEPPPIEEHEGPDGLLADALAALRSGAPELAFPALIEAERLAPWLPRTQRVLALHALAEGDVQTAIEHYEMALRLDPRDERAAAGLKNAKQ